MTPSEDHCTGNRRNVESAVTAGFLHGASRARREDVHHRNRLGSEYSATTPRSARTATTRPTKKKSTERIDGIVAVIMALARSMLELPSAPSYYENNPLTFV